MFNKKYMLKTKKGILLTLLMIIVLILMMAELITYVTLNIGYDNLAADTSLAGSSSSFISSINPFISTFLHSSLFNAVNLMIAYESNPKLRGDYFINNTNYQIYQIMNGNGINGYGNSIAFNIANYTKDLESEASAKGINLTITNSRLDIYQNSPVSISANYKAVAKLWYVCGEIFGGLGLRNDTPVVGRPPGFDANIPFQTVSVTTII